MAQLSLARLLEIFLRDPFQLSVKRRPEVKPGQPRTQVPRRRDQEKGKKQPDTHRSLMRLIRAWFITWKFVGFAELRTEAGERFGNDVL